MVCCGLWGPMAVLPVFVWGRIVLVARLVLLPIVCLVPGRRLEVFGWSVWVLPFRCPWEIVLTSIVVTISWRKRFERGAECTEPCVHEASV